MKHFLLILLITIQLNILPASSAVLNDNYPKIANVEEIIFGKSSPDLKTEERLTTIEKNLFGETYSKDSLSNRTKRIVDYVLGPINEDYDSEAIASDLKDKSSEILPHGGYENIQTSELTEGEFLDTLLLQINDQRSFKGLLPLTKDDIAMKVANDQATTLISKGYLSFYNEDEKGPDERYTLSGGSGTLVEIVKGFEIDKSETKKTKIKLTPLLAKQLLQALSTNTDDSQILYNIYNTHIGIGFLSSKDRSKFVSVIEFVTKKGDFEPIKPQIALGENLLISGKLQKPFKFKAISIAYFEDERTKLTDTPEQFFDNESIEPYFPPQSYIAYGDTGKGNFITFLKGVGVVGAIGAAPFTGGASAVLAPALLNSIQNGPAKEVPLKGGIKYSSKTGEFSGHVPINHQGKSGLYLVSVIAEVPGVNYPIVISRRTVRVKGVSLI